MTEEIKKESGGAGLLGGGIGFQLEFNTTDCQGGWAVTKVGTGQVLACYTTKEHAQAAMEALAVNQPDVTKSDEKGQVDQDEQEGIGRLNFWDGSFAPVFGFKQYQDARYNSTYNSPPQHDGKPTVGYGNSSSPKGRSNQ